MYGNVQETKNLMSHYESDGDYVNYSTFPADIPE
mgnify:CR=1 FL=1